MLNYDVFNGDADGICALVQLRLAEPRDAKLITGVKRDIDLLRRVQAQPGSQVTVLDVSLDRNRADLERILAEGATVFYSDHHYAGDIPQHPQLQTLINPAADVCTSLLLNNHLHGAYRAWAVVGTFGDNLKDSAARIAKPLGLDQAALEQLEKLGIYINYNGYGARLEDLHFAPGLLYQRLSHYADPFVFMREDREDFQHLEHGYREDMAAAAALVPEHLDAATAVYVLPDAAWARRVSGVFSNDLANADPGRGHAVITARPDGDYLVSVRAPLSNKTGADVLCREFPTGGGRAAAAGINALPATELRTFIDRFAAFYA
ncbi:DHH family phosphoesterase [Kineobactrum salinum]|uniref:DHH family phosphoesterase n=1 Tax=Kineobactrum salinum TaxID=2708301 RepID=A0A6C0TXV3_9GAMM|nr:DHH family phosphoesterase [Kineobactrum salinum]QIB64662.1 DHH family phosphoesterase [Kineobactrum salinum]